MTEHQSLLDHAVMLHQSGRVREAIDIYSQLLPGQRNNAQLQFLLGLAHLQTGQLGPGIEWLEGSLTLQPDNADAHYNIGAALQALRRPNEALIRYGKALALRPDHADSWFNQGTAFEALGRQDEALLSYDKALALQPRTVNAHYNRGNILQALERPDAALASYDRALALHSRFAEAHFNRGNVLQQLERPDEALSSYDTALAIRPDYAEVHANRGNLLREQKRLDEALASYGRALTIKPDYAEGYSNRGTAYQALKRMDEALADYDKALAIRPGHAGAWYNRGTALQALGELEDALASYEKALTIKPDYAEAAFGKATILIGQGKYREGWPLYESRLKRKDVQKNVPVFPQPVWRGDDIRGKRLLVYAEQGFGDLIQFCRYLPLVHRLGADLIVEVPQPILSFISTLRCPMSLVAKGAPLPAFDRHCSMASLPHLLKTTVETIPAQSPYLFSDPDQVKLWQERLGRKDRPRIGLAWSGSDRHENDLNRSMKLNDVLPLTGLPFAEWHSLQIEYRSGDLETLGQHPEILQHQDELRGFANTAAFVECMDLVITVDSSMAHLAGALGKPVWILLPFSPDYRWLLERTDSPWYPTARLYRQPQFGDWQSVIATVHRDLANGLAKQG